MELDESTIRWLQSLPPELAPWELACTFPRVAKKLCELWKRPSRCDVYFNDLMLNQRQRRDGFPARVMRELGNLFAHYTELYPAQTPAWIEARKR
jgi:hypothetical protein